MGHSGVATIALDALTVTNLVKKITKTGLLRIRYELAKNLLVFVIGQVLLHCTNHLWHAGKKKVIQQFAQLMMI